MELAEKLRKFGSRHPDLRPHVRSILDHLRPKQAFEGQPREIEKEVRDWFECRGSEVIEKREDDEETVIVVGGHPCEMDELDEGESIKVRYEKTSKGRSIRAEVVDHIGFHLGTIEVDMDEDDSIAKGVKELSEKAGREEFTSPID